MALEYIWIPAGTIAFIYLIRKIREHNWGWVTNKSSLKGKIYIITGANTGLGYETTKHLFKRGATVILACRNGEKANEAIQKIKASAPQDPGKLIHIELDLASFESIRSFAKKINTEYSSFDCLINNAGLAVRDHTICTKENYELTFGVNHLGHFLLFTLLEDNIRRNSSRVVVVSSKLHERGQIDFAHLGKYNGSRVTLARNQYYNDSKLANSYFARELYKKGIDCHVLCPGLCNTDFFRDYNPRWYHYLMFSPVVWLMLRTAEQGAQNIIYCATDNKNSDEKNPSTGYFIGSLKQEKSKVHFNDEISERLWKESLNMCHQ